MTSQEEEVAIVHRLVDAWNREDLEGLLALADPGIEYVNAPTAIEPGVRRGHDGLATVARAQWEGMAGAFQEIEEVHVGDGEIITEGRISRRTPGSDASA